MDLSVLFAEGAKLGFVVILLLSAVVYLVRRFDRLSQDERERVAMTLAQNRDDCVRRERDLSERLRQVEDRQHGEHAEILHRASDALTHSAAALECNARAFEILVKQDSGVHRALDRNHKDN